MYDKVSDHSHIKATESIENCGLKIGEAQQHDLYETPSKLILILNQRTLQGFRI